MNTIPCLSEFSRLDLTQNCTVEALARAKCLPTPFLNDLGLRTVTNPYDSARQAVAIPYRTSDGSLFRYRLRSGLHKSDVGPDQRMLWDRRSDKPGTCLFGADRMPGSGERIILVEGESDTMTLWHHGYTALGVPGAANYNPNRDDLLLDDRDVIAIMEKDEGGKALLRKLSASAHRGRVRVAVLEHFKDVSDMHVACPERFDDRLDKAFSQAVPLDRLLADCPELDAAAQIVRSDLPNGFRYCPDGHIEYLVKGKDSEANWNHLCSPIEFLAVTRDGDQHNWGRLIRVLTPDGHWNRSAIPMNLLAGSGEELRRLLFDMGLEFEIGRPARLAISSLIASAKPSARALSVPHVGWNGQRFVLPDQTIGGDDTELVVFQPHSPIKHAYYTQGTLEDWQYQVARYAIGNSRLAIALATAFAGPLLQLVDMEGGGIHFRGASSTGKTTVLHVAGSVWGGGGLGGYIQRWRATDNALEGIALAHCDTLLALDELAEVEGKAAGKSAYMLANGQGKARSNRAGDLRPAAEWRTIFLSTGEISLSDKVAEGQTHRTTAGQEVRIVDLSADAECGHGIFENLHGYNRPSDLADHLRTASAQYYGYASRIFLEHLTSDLEGYREKARRLMDAWLEYHCPSEADGQVRRVARRFALIAAAGELAIAMTILPWPKGEAHIASGHCFEDWLHARGGTEPFEMQQGIECIRAFVQRHATSRFADWTEPNKQIYNRAGLRRPSHAGTYVYMFREAFVEACAGLDPTMVARALAERGMLKRDRDGKSTRSERLPGIGKGRVYVLTPALFGDETDA